MTEAIRIPLKDALAATRIVKTQCHYCGEEITIEAYRYRYGETRGQTRHYCSRSCGRKQQLKDMRGIE